jgi:hypothetical protein
MPLIPVRPAPYPGEIDAFFDDPSPGAGPLNDAQGRGLPCASPLGPITRAPAPQRSGGRAGARGRKEWRSTDRKQYRHTPASSGTPAGRTSTVSGYPDLGSIATFTSDQGLQIADLGDKALKIILKKEAYLNARAIIDPVVRRFPLREVGTGKLKYHQKEDGSRVTYCGTCRADEGGMVGACRNKPYGHAIKGIPNTCKRRACPECYVEWSKKAAQRVSSTCNGYVRMNVPKALQERVYQALAGLPENEDPADRERLLKAAEIYLPRHVMISPPASVVAALVQRTIKDWERKFGSRDGPNAWRYANEFYSIFLKKYRRKVDQVIRLAGLYAYEEVTHDIRLKSKKDDRKADRQMDANRYREVLDLPCWRAGVNFSPHSHMIGWGPLMPAERFEKESDGWIYVNFGTVTNAAGLVKYLLSHAPDVQGKHSIRPCGALNPSRLAVVGEVKVPREVYCEECVEEGIELKNAVMVLARLKSVEYHRDKDKHSHLVSWEFTDAPTGKPYRTTTTIQVYRPVDPADRKRRPPDPPPRIAPWLSEEEKAEQLRLWQLQKAERDRLRRVAQWLPWKDWIRLAPEERHRYRWRWYISPEHYAELTNREKMRFHEWV